MNDMISRQAAIDAIVQYLGRINRDFDNWKCTARIILDHVPSAQPEIEERMSETEQNVPNDDFISRKGAIDALMEDFKRIPTNAIRAKTVIEQLPSAQPETARRIVGKSRDGMTLWYQCDMCNEPVDKQDVYCRGCGRRFVDE